MNWDENSTDQKTVISYHKNPELRIQSREAAPSQRGQASIWYIDDDQSGMLLDQASSEGSDGEKITFSSDPYAEILKYENNGYELVSNNYSSTAEYNSKSPQLFQVHLKHKKEQVTRSQTVTFTYNFVSSLDRHQIRESITDSKSMTQSGMKDLVTSATVWDSAPSVQFDSFDLPKVEGYVSQQKTAEAMDYEFDPYSEQNYTQTFVYDPVYTCEIRIIDDTDNKLLQTLTTEANNTDPSSYLKQADVIYDWETKGYDLVSDNSENQKLNPYPDQNIYEIHLKHHVSEEYETRTVTRTIHYVNASDQTDIREPYTQSVNVMVKVSKDYVTNKKTFISLGQTSLSAWTSPEIANMKCMLPTVPEKKITTENDLKNTDVYVSYVPENTAVIEFIDDDSDGKVISTLSAQGVNGEPIVFEKDPYEVLSGWMEKNYYQVSNTWQTGTKYQKDGSNHYEIHLKHRTEPVTAIHPVGTHIHYVDYTTERSIYPDKEIHYDLVRSGTKDLALNEVSWGPEPSWTVPVEDVPEIEGYRPDVDKTFSTTLWFDKVDQGPGQSYIWEQYVKYKKIYTGSLKIIDDTTGKTLKTLKVQNDEGSGAENFTYDPNYNFNEDAAVKDYLNNGYKKVSSNYPGTLTWKADNHFEIHLKHKTDTKDQKEIVSRTIHFVDQNGNAVKADQVQTITFNLTDTVDQVTGDILKTECTNGPQSFIEMQAPKIANMSPLDLSVPALSVDYKDGLKNFEATIHYADTKSASISFIDDTTNTSLKEMSASGAEGSQITFEQDPDSVIQSYEAKGWKRVSSDWNKGSVYTSENKFTVHLTHNTVPYSETRTYTDECRFIDVYTNKEVAEANTRSVQLTGKGTRDMVTGKITWTDTPSYTFPAIDIPKVAGYKNPEWDGQPYTVTFGGSSLKTSVPYKKVYSGTLKIIDDTDNKTLETLNITDSFSNAADFGQKGLLEGYLAEGYVLVSDNSENKTLAWQPAVNEFEIHLQHKKDPVTGTKTVKRFINYVNAVNEETVAPTVTQSVTLNVEGIKDEVTQETMWISDYASYAFEEVWSPKIEDMRCLTPLVKEEAIVFSSELKDTTVTVRYQPENQALIDFIDDTDGSIIAYYASQGLSGKPIIWPADPTNTISSLEARGYKFVSSDWQDGKLYEENGNSHYSVHFVHRTEKVKQTRTFKRTIHYVNEVTGKAVLPDKIQNVQFHETGVKDLVTGKTAWTPAEQQILPAVDSPEVDGMMALTKSVPALIVPDDENLKDLEATVKYRQILNAEIIYRDDTEKKDILKDTAQGSPNVKIQFKEDPAKQIQDLEDQGYKLGENNWKDGSTFSADSSNKFIVHFVHKTESTSKTETVKASYSFQDASTGNDLKNPIEKTHDLIWNGTKDLVTKKITWEKEPSWTFKAMDSPEIEGYQPEQARFDPAAVSFSQKFADLVMDYNPVYSGTLKIIDDTTGKVLNSRTIQDSLSKTPDFGQESLIAGYSEQGYELVSDGVADKKLSHNPDENSFEIHLKHRSEPLQKTKTISRTIHYVNAQTSKSVAPDFSQSLTFVQNGHKDLVAGSTVWDKPQNLQFTAVKSPEIEHLRCLNPAVPVKEVTYSDDLKDSEVTVRYQPEDQAVLDFVDDDEDGKILDSFITEGVDGQKVNFKKDPADRISELEKQNYVLAANDWNDDKVFKKNEDNHYQIHFTHKKEDVSKDGLYTLNVKFKDAASHEEIHDEANYEHPYTVAGKKDLVNGNTEWETPDGYTFDEFSIPDVDGYKPESETADPQVADADNPDLNLTVYYDRLYKASLEIIDSADNKRIDLIELPSSVNDEAALGQKKRMKTYEDLGYEFDHCDFDFDSKFQKIPSDPNGKTWHLYLKHQSAPYSEDRELTRTINYVNGVTGAALAPSNVQTVSYVLEGEMDKVTGNTIYCDCDPLEFDEVISPKIKDYNCRMPIVKSMKVSYSEYLGNIDMDVEYFPETHAVIQFIDDDAKDGHTPVKGLTTTEETAGNDGDLIQFKEDPKDVIKAYEDKGYELISNSYNSGTRFYDHVVNQFEVHFRHKIADENREEEVSRTIRFVDKNGKELKEPVVQKLTLRQTGRKDLVFGTTEWDPVEEQTFDEVAVPQIEGYTSSETTIVAAPAESGQKNIDVTIVFVKTGKPNQPGNQDKPDHPSDLNQPGKTGQNGSDHSGQNQNTFRKTSVQYAAETSKKDSRRSSISTAVSNGAVQFAAMMSAAAAGIGILLSKKRRK